MSGPPFSLDVFTVSASSLFQVDGSELELLQHLHDSVYQQTQDWYQRLGSRIREQINRQYGTMPDKEENIQVWAFAKVFFYFLIVWHAAPILKRYHNTMPNGTI